MERDQLAIRRTEAQRLTWIKGEANDALGGSKLPEGMAEDDVVAGFVIVGLEVDDWVGAVEGDVRT